MFETSDFYVLVSGVMVYVLLDCPPDLEYFTWSSIGSYPQIFESFEICWLGFSCGVDVKRQSCSIALAAVPLESFPIFTQGIFYPHVTYVQVRFRVLL